MGHVTRHHASPPPVAAERLRDALPFAPARVGEGPEWGGLVVEEYRGEPPSAIVLPPVSHHHLTLYLGGDREHRVRRFIGATGPNISSARRSRAS